MNKKKIGLIGACLVIIIALFIRGVILKVNNDGITPSTAVETGERVVRAELAKEVCLLFYSRKDVEDFPIEMIYTDMSEDAWYNKYVNALYGLGLIAPDIEGQQEKFRPLDYMTYGECQEILRRLSAVYGMERKKDENFLLKTIEESTGIATESWSKDKFLRQDTWHEILGVLIKEIGGDKIEEKNLLILGTGADNSALGEWETVTDKGTFYTDGFRSADYVDQVVKAMVREDMVLYAEESEDSITLHNAWIEKSSFSGEDSKQAGTEGHKELTLFFGGIRRTLKTENILSEEIQKVIGDITIQNKKVVKVQIKPDIITGKVLSVDKDYIVLENESGEHKLSFEKDFKIYRVYSETEIEIAKGILVGYNNMDFVMEKDKICAALIKSRLKAEHIRVLIKNNEFKDLFHEGIKITSEDPFTVTSNGVKEEYGAGSEFSVDTQSRLLADGRIFIKSGKENGKLTVTSLVRNGVHPSYRGDLEISLYEEGKLLLVNEVSVEEYLYAVVPSEMPSSYGVEALKAQAVCARSYAYNQLMSNSYSNYGAHVDDSVSFQVYNNLPENENTIMAVKETYGQVLEHEGKIITAYYYSTSCGHTSNAHDVWISTEKLPYLEARWQIKDKKAQADGLNLTREETFKDFITQNPADTYDSGFAWYRWKVDIPAAHLKKTIEASIGKRYKANPNLILTRNDSGEYESLPVDTIGEVKKITVMERKTGGIATAVKIEGSERTIKVISEYNIRLLLAPTADSVIRQDESLVENLTMLPSSFFIVEKTADEGEDGTSFRFTGGGYGHGVGMSQNGAKAMTDEGFTYEEVLKHYYSGVNIGFIY